METRKNQIRYIAIAAGEYLKSPRYTRYDVYKIMANSPEINLSTGDILSAVDIGQLIVDAENGIVSYPSMGLLFSVIGEGMLYILKVYLENEKSLCAEHGDYFPSEVLTAVCAELDGRIANDDIATNDMAEEIEYIIGLLS